jgi:hypothetical protein
MMAQAGGEEGLVDVVALNVLRRAAAYSCRLRLFEGGTFTVQSVVISASVTWRRPGVPAPAVRRKALASAAAGSASRGGRDDGRSSRTAAQAGVGLLAGPSDQQIGCGRVTGGWRRAVLAPCAGGL